MVNVMVAMAAHVASLLNNKTVAFNKAIVSLTYRGLLKGYSWANLTWLGKQVAHETAWGDSRSIHEDKNAWGMNRVYVRDTTQIGHRTTDAGEELGVYSTIDSSTIDRFLWDNYWGFDGSKSSTSYPAEVGTKYHTSNGYVGAVDAVDAGAIRIAMITAVVMVPVEILLIGKAIAILKK